MIFIAKNLIEQVLISSLYEFGKRTFGLRGIVRVGFNSFQPLSVWRWGEASPGTCCTAVIDNHPSDNMPWSRRVRSVWRICALEARCCILFEQIVRDDDAENHSRSNSVCGGHYWRRCTLSSFVCKDDLWRFY